MRGVATLDASTAIAIVRRLHATLEARRPEIKRFDDYYEGRQPLKFASREWSDFHKDRYRGFADNWCAVVPDALNERLRVTGLSVPDAERESRMVFDAMKRSNFEAQSSQGFLETAVAKRSFVTVWGTRDGDPEITWEHPSQAIVDYDPLTRAPRYALKSWEDDGWEYASLYTSQALWKFRRRSSVPVVDDYTPSGIFVAAISSSGSDWAPYQPDTDDTWPAPHPLGDVPVVEIPNRPRLQRGPISDIHGVVPMQDAINLLWSFLFASADHASLNGRVIMGAKPPQTPVLDRDGQMIGTKDVDIKALEHGRFLWLTGENAKIGEFSRANLEVFTNVIEIEVGHISAQSRVPAHYFVANSGLSNVNGETLTATETPLVKKAEEFQLFTSSPLARVARLAAVVMGMDGLAGAIRPDSFEWANPAIRSESQLVDALLKRAQMGYPFEWLLRLEGISQADREAIMEMKQREQSDPDIAVLADRMSSVLNA